MVTLLATILSDINTDMVENTSIPVMGDAIAIVLAVIGLFLIILYRLATHEKRLEQKRIKREKKQKKKQILVTVIPMQTYTIEVIARIGKIFSTPQTFKIEATSEADALKKIDKELNNPMVEEWIKKVV